jgi:hypothetical protein
MRKKSYSGWQSGSRDKSFCCDVVNVYDGEESIAIVIS